MTHSNPAHRYRAFNLEIESQLALPELKPSAGKRDIAIRLGKVSNVGNGATSDRCVRASEGEVLLYWEKGGAFLMRGGVEMIVEPAADAEEALVRTGILGPGLATLAQQRGHLVLHASSVIIDGKAIAFVGWKGQGKSTLAARLFARGHPLLTDDLLALNGTDEHRILAHPGFPQIKLWPDSVIRSLGETPDDLPKLLPDYEKCVRTVTAGFAPAPAPLCAIYVLTTGAEFQVQRLAPQETFKQIVSNTFCARYGTGVFTGKIGTVHLQNVAKTAAKVPVFQILRPRSLTGLDSLADLVERHAANL